MRFLSKEEARPLEKQARREIDDQGEPKVVLYYDSGNRDYSDAARAITEAAGPFTKALVLFTFCVSVDDWDEDPNGNGAWHQYRRWRKARNELRRIYEAPGHLVEGHEPEDFSEIIRFALLLGWDVVVTARPGRQLLLLSHDDRLELYRGFNRSGLARALTMLGYWRW